MSEEIDRFVLENNQEIIEDVLGLQREIAAKDTLNNDLMANCNQLRDRCWKAEGEIAKWQKIAIDERAQRIISMEPEAKFDRYGLQECPRIGYICDENDGHCVLSECPSKTFWRQTAAQELHLEMSQSQSYVWKKYYRKL